MTTIEKIRDVLGLPMTKLYAESRLDDGRVIVTEDEAFEPGVEIKVIDDAGEALPLEKGTYTLDSGDKVEINEDGRLVNLGGEEEELEVEVVLAEEEEKVEEEVEEVEEEEELNFEAIKAAFMEAYPDLDLDLCEGLAKIAAKVYETEAVEEMAATEKEDDLNATIEEAFNAISDRLKALENAPASEGVNHSPNKATVKRNRSNKKFNAIERAMHNINMNR